MKENKLTISRNLGFLSKGAGLDYTEVLSL